MVQVNCFWNRDDRYYKKGGWKGSQDLDGGTLFTQFSQVIDLILLRQVDFQYPAKLVWCGTSLSGGSLDEVEVSRQTRFQVRKLKAFTVTTENAKVRLELNLLSVLREQLETSWNRLQQETTEEPILVIECGVNNITNIGEDRKEADRLRRVELKMREFFSIAADLKRQKKLEKSGAVAQNSPVR